MGLLVLYLFSSVCLYGLILLDKQKAIKGRWRIPEKDLMLWAVFGGAIGGWIAMKRFNHKTKKALFKYGFPILSILQIILFSLELIFVDFSV